MIGWRRMGGRSTASWGTLPPALPLPPKGECVPQSAGMVALPHPPSPLEPSRIAEVGPRGWGGVEYGQGHTWLFREAPPPLPVPGVEGPGSDVTSTPGPRSLRDGPGSTGHAQIIPASGPCPVLHRKAKKPFRSSSDLREKFFLTPGLTPEHVSKTHQPCNAFAMVIFQDCSSLYGSQELGSVWTKEQNTSASSGWSKQQGFSGLPPNHSQLLSHILTITLTH